MRLFKSHSMMQLGSGSSRSASSNGLVPMFNEHGPPPDSAAYEHTSHSAKSGDSGDSGISDPGPGEDYSFVITENSPSELVRRVEQEFVPVENINLIITGKACPRMLSGYQKTRIEEAAILESLREEGFIATSKTKSAGGISFEVMEATPQALSAGSKTKPQDFLPSAAIKKMEERRNKFGPGDRTSEDVLQKWQDAQRRREAEIEARQEKMAELRKGTEVEKKRMEVLAAKQENKNDAALQKREAHLKELRDKLRAQNLHAQQVKLKKLVNAPPVPVPMFRGASASYGGPTTDIFFG